MVAARGVQAEMVGATAYNRGQVIYRLAEMAESRRDELASHVAARRGDHGTRADRECRSGD